MKIGVNEFPRNQLPKRDDIDAPDYQNSSIDSRETLAVRNDNTRVSRGADRRNKTRSVKPNATVARAKGLHLLFGGRNRSLKLPWVAFQNELDSVCFWKHPVWPAYVKEHNDILNKKKPPRFLIWSAGASQGIGNLLRGLELCFYLAIASGRALLIRWRYPVDVEEVFEPREIDWRISKVSRFRSALNAEVSHVDFFDFYQMISGSQLEDLVFSSKPEVWIESNQPAAGFKTLRLSSLGFKNTTLQALVQKTSRMRGCAFHSLFRFREKGAMAKLWASIEQTIPPGPRLGIQLRFGDASMSSNSFGQRKKDKRPILNNNEWGLASVENAASQAVTCAQQLAEGVGWRAPCVIILETDSQKAKHSAIHKPNGPCKVWTSRQAPRHTAYEGSKDWGFETWIAFVRLTIVEVLLYTFSTFGESAGRIGPALVEYQRLVSFTDFLMKRSQLKISSDITQDLCALNRQPGAEKAKLGALLTPA